MRKNESAAQAEISRLRQDAATAGATTQDQQKQQQVALIVNCSCNQLLIHPQDMCCCSAVHSCKDTQGDFWVHHLDGVPASRHMNHLLQECMHHMLRL